MRCEGGQQKSSGPSVTVPVSHEHLQCLDSDSQLFRLSFPKLICSTEHSVMVFLLFTKNTNCNLATIFFQNCIKLKEVSDVTAFSGVSFMDTAGNSSVLKDFYFKLTPASCWSQTQQMRRRGIPPAALSPRTCTCLEQCQALMDTKDLTPTEVGLFGGGGVFVLVVWFCLFCCLHFLVLHILKCPQLSGQDTELSQHPMGWPITTTPGV